MLVNCKQKQISKDSDFTIKKRSQMYLWYLIWLALLSLGEDSTAAVWFVGHKNNPSFVFCYDCLEQDLVISDNVWHASTHAAALFINVQLTHKLCGDLQHVQVVPYSFWDVPHKPPISKMVFHLTLVNFLYIFIHLTCGGKAWTLVTFSLHTHNLHLRFPQIWIKKNHSKACFLLDALSLKTVFSMSCISVVVFLNLKWNSADVLFQKITLNTYKTRNTWWHVKQSVMNARLTALTQRQQYYGI